MHNGERQLWKDAFEADPELLIVKAAKRRRMHRQQGRQGLVGRSITAVEGGLQSEGHAPFAYKDLRWRNHVKYQGASDLVWDWMPTHV